MLFAPRVTASRKITFILPWLFILAVGAAALVPSKWPGAPRGLPPASTSHDPLWRELEGRHRVDALSTLDGDTFVARIHLASGQSFTTRVRLRSVDAPEMEASCDSERRRAERATAALRTLLRQGGVTIFNVGPDKYQGRIVADVATRQTSDVSETLIRAGHGRPYAGGHRDGWC
jgi:endonuclease YncB( thermonuclease family)